MDVIATAAVFYPKVREMAESTSSGCSKVATKGDDSSSVQGGSSMDGFKVACIFAKVEFVGYAYSLVRTGLEM